MKQFLEILGREDYAIFESIEVIRERIRAKDIMVEVEDFGAGNPDEGRTTAQMHAGVMKQVSTQELCRIGLKSEYAQLIYSLIKRYKPTNVLELGTCCGFSCIYMAKASKSANIYTIEGSKNTAAIAKENIKTAECDNITVHIGRFSDVLVPLLEQVKCFEFVFIDGHHDEVATLEYFALIKPYLSENALVLFDDIAWSEGMKVAWQEILRDKDIKRAIDFTKLGLVYMGESDDLV